MRRIVPISAAICLALPGWSTSDAAGSDPSNATSCAEFSMSSNADLHFVGKTLSDLNNAAELFGRPHIDMGAFTKQDFIEFISAIVVDCLQTPQATIYNATKAEYASTLLSGKPYVTR